MGAEEMIGRYHSIFVLPSDVKKVLGEAGWEFASPNRLSRKMLDALVDRLRLMKSDAYLGIEEFIGSSIKVIAFLDSDGAIEHVCIRAYEGSNDAEIDSALTSLSDPSIEIFNP
jgi:hypothetical protein